VKEHPKCQFPLGLHPPKGVQHLHPLDVVNPGDPEAMGLLLSAAQDREDLIWSGSREVRPNQLDGALEQETGRLPVSVPEDPPPSRVGGVSTDSAHRQGCAVHPDAVDV